MISYSELIWILGLGCTAAGVVLLVYINREPGAMIPWNDPEDVKKMGMKISFVIRRDMLEHIDVWVHEFSELTIVMLLPNDLRLREMGSRLFGVYFNVEHILVSLHSISVVDDRVIHPEEFEREFSLYQPKARERVDFPIRKSMRIGEQNAVS